jgi:hypothetical protein
MTADTIYFDIAFISVYFCHILLSAVSVQLKGITESKL